MASDPTQAVRRGTSPADHDATPPESPGINRPTSRAAMSRGGIRPPRHSHRHTQPRPRARHHRAERRPLSRARLLRTTAAPALPFRAAVPNREGVPRLRRAALPRCPASPGIIDSSASADHCEFLSGPTTSSASPAAPASSRCSSSRRSPARCSGLLFAFATTCRRSPRSTTTRRAPSRASTRSTARSSASSRRSAASSSATTTSRRVLRQAIIAAEDADFDTHFGLSIPRIVITATSSDIISRRSAPARARSRSSWRATCS